MKKLLIFSLLALFAFGSFAQDRVDSILLAMSNFDEVHSRYLGPLGQKSKLYILSDLLEIETTLSQKIEIFDTSNTVIKYYTFLAILWADDIIGLEKLKQIGNDTSTIYTRFGCSIGGDYFNSLLFKEYYTFTRLKYYQGFRGYSNGRYYLFPKNNRKIWKQKEQKLKALLETYLDKPFIPFSKYGN